MMLNSKWLRPLAIAMSIPGASLGSAWLLFTLVEKKIITQETAVIIFSVLSFSLLFNLVLYGFKKKG